LKKATLAVLLFMSALAWAGTNPNPADYTINVHVSRSRSVIEGSPNRRQKLNVVIDGKKYELEGYGGEGMLALGDYKAKLVKDEHKGGYDSLQVYEFLFPDQKTRKFMLVGQTE
jgi:hypothetical protein